MEFMSNIHAMDDDARPSLFELLSETQLRDLLGPTVRYLLAVATHRHPRYLIRILNRFDECYALLLLLIERHYLLNYSASFTENFYGLKRARCISPSIPRTRAHAADLVAASEKLSRRDVWKSLFVIVGLPYLKRKLDDAYEIHAGGAAASVLGAGYVADELPEDATVEQTVKYYLKLVLRKTYPTINGAYYLATLGFSLAYLFDKTHYHTPADWFIGVRMRRLTEADHHAFEAASKPKPRAGKRPALSAATFFSPSIITHILLPKLLDSLKLLLPTSIFFLKFLEWWHASDFARQLSAKTAASIELPPPKSVPVRKAPPPEEEGEEERMKVTVEVPEDTADCPICRKDITNPTAVQTGYVFCYPCVFRWVSEGADAEGVEEEDRIGRCPITGTRLLGGTEGLRRLMI